MKELIEYNYNIELEEVDDGDELTSFYYYGNLYIFVVTIRSKKELDEIISCSEELQQKNVKSYSLIKNKDGKSYVNIGEEVYVLLKIDEFYKKEVDIVKMIEINKKTLLNKTSKGMYKNLWGKLWSEKIDYFEYQVSQLGKDKEIILDSISYYIGLAENAISIVNKMNSNFKDKTECRVCLCHRRIYQPNYELNYYNPLSYIFDLEIRDIAEYIKSQFYKGNDALLDLSTYLKCVKLCEYEYNMLFARILYPSQYFDLYEKVMIDNENQNILISIIAKIEEFEEFIFEVYNEISKYSKVECINWLTKST